MADTKNSIDHYFLDKIYFKTFGQYGVVGSHFDDPKGICIGPRGDDILVCDHGNHRVQVFDSNGKFIRIIGSYSNHMGLTFPTGICASQSRIFVCDGGNKRIRIYDRDYNPVSQISVARYIPYSPVGNLTVTKKGNIVFNNGYQTWIMDSRGKLLVTSWTLCDMVWCNSKDEIISKCGETIKIMDQNLNLLDQFCVKGKIITMCVDRRDNILVVIQGFGIAVYNRNGTLVGHVKNYNSPQGICTLNGRIITSNSNNTISISGKRIVKKKHIFALIERTYFFLNKNFLFKK